MSARGHRDGRDELLSSPAMKVSSDALGRKSLRGKSDCACLFSVPKASSGITVIPEIDDVDRCARASKDLPPARDWLLA